MPNPLFPILYVTHDQRTATALGDQIAIVRDGEIEQAGPPSTVLTRPTSRFVARFTGNENLIEATVTDRAEDGATVLIGDIQYETNTSDIHTSTVTVCIHPSRIEIEAPYTTDGDRTTNTVTGTVARWLNEGSEYRIDIKIEAGSITLTANVRPSTFERLALESGSEVQVLIPKESIHLIPESNSSQTSTH